MPPKEEEKPRGSIESLDTASHPFLIDNINKKIVVPRGVNKATSSRAFLKLRPEFMLSGVLESSIANVTVLGGDSETTLNSYTAPLNTISRNYAGSGSSGEFFVNTGNVFRITASGIFGTSSSGPTVQVHIEAGSTTLLNIISPVGSFSTRPWRVEGILTFSTIGSSAAVEAQGWGFFDTNLRVDPNSSTFSVDTTADVVFNVTGTWSGGAANTNTLTIRQFLVELLN